MLTLAWDTQLHRMEPACVTLARRHERNTLAGTQVALMHFRCKVL
jgi:hypothetical protein